MATLAAPLLEEFFGPFWSPSSAGWQYGGGQAGGPAALPITGGASAPGGTSGGGAAQTCTRAIPVDFIEREGEYVLRGDMPGVHKSEIRVSVDGNIVRFGHQPHPDREQKDETEKGIFHRAERVSSFRGRALRMPDSADCDNISAKYEDGVLEIKIAKKQLEQSKAEGRVIQIA